MSNSIGFSSSVACVVLTLVAVPVSAGAQPPSGGVPDMSGFADVTGDFIVHGVPARPGTLPGVGFATVDGVDCRFLMSSDPSTFAGSNVECSGPLPGIADLPVGGTHGVCDWGGAEAGLGTPSGHVWLNRPRFDAAAV